MRNDLSAQADNHYRAWLGELKSRFRQIQGKAAVSVNTALLQFYWELGADIVARQAEADWGSGFLAQFSADLMHEFPEMKGFSASNLKYIRQWYLFYSVSPAIGQQPVGQILAIPWGHNLAIIAKCKQHTEALYYVQKTLEHGWSRSVLVHQIECFGSFHLADERAPDGRVSRAFQRAAGSGQYCAFKLQNDHRACRFD